MNRRTPGTVLGSLGVEAPAALDDMRSIQAGINLVWQDTLRQENSGSRSRALVAVLLAAVKGLEVGEYGERIEALEEAIHQPGRRAA